MPDNHWASSPSHAVSRRQWAALLAGGDGTRLRDLTFKIAGDSRPKQFCGIVEGKSLLSQTRTRLEPLFCSDRQLLILSRAHEKYYGEDLTGVDDSSVIVQPVNRGTGVAIALATLHMLQLQPDAIIAFFPCDHYYSDEDGFRATAHAAVARAEQYPDSIILVGAKAEYPEIDYGWIEPGSKVEEAPAGSLSRVSRFWEKPSLDEARALLSRGCLWNTFVTVGRAEAFLDLLCSQIPEVVLCLARALADRNLDRAFDCLEAVDFSRDVLTRQPQRLFVLHDETSGWADLGTPARVLETLDRNGIRPEWACAAGDQARRA